MPRPYKAPSGHYQLARENHVSVYDGKPCKRCGGTRRYVANRCCINQCSSTSHRFEQMPDDDCALVAELRRGGMPWSVIAEKFEVTVFDARRSLANWRRE